VPDSPKLNDTSSADLIIPLLLAQACPVLLAPRQKQFSGIEAWSWERRRPAGQFKLILQHAGGTPALPEDALRKLQIGNSRKTCSRREVNYPLPE
jgi:hypothetical protein